MNDEIKKEIEEYKANYTFKYWEDPKFKELFCRYCARDYDEFIFEEALNIYTHTENDELKVRILEFLRQIRY